MVSSEQSVSNAFTSAGLIPGHVDFTKYVVPRSTTPLGVFMTLTFHWFLPTDR